MADLVRVHGVRVYAQNLDEQPGECRVDAVADPAAIDRLVAAGCRVDRHEDVGEAAKDSLRHIGRGNRHTDTSNVDEVGTAITLAPAPPNAGFTVLITLPTATSPTREPRRRPPAGRSRAETGR